MLTMFPFAHDIRSGPGRVVAEVLAKARHLFVRDHVCGRHGEKRQERAERFFKLQYQGMIVRSPDAGDRARLTRGKIARSFDLVKNPGERGLCYGVQYPLERIAEVAGCYIPARIEPDIRPQPKSVGQLVMGKGPGRGEVGHDIQIFIEAHQSVKELCSDAAAHYIRDQRGVEAGRIGVQAKVQVPGKPFIIRSSAG